MDVNSIFSFILVAILYIGSPGPAVVYFTINSAEYSTRDTVKPLLGNSFGLATHALVAATGLGIVLNAHENVLYLLAMIGGGYLIYLGVKKLGSLRSTIANVAGEFTPSFASGYLLAVTNPKPLIFFSVILPSIAGVGASIYDIAMLSLIFVTLSFAILCVYSILSGKILNLFSSERSVTVVNGASAAIFAIMGIMICYQAIASSSFSLKALGF